MIIEKVYTNTLPQDEILTFCKGLNIVNCEYSISHNPIIPMILNKVFGYTPEYHIFYDETNNIIGYMPGVLVGNKFVSVPHFSYGGIASKDSSIIKEYECKIDRPYLIRSYNETSKYYDDNKVVAYLNIENGEESIFPQLKYNIRRQIRIATESGIVIKIGKEELLDDFLKVYRKNMFRLGSPPQPAKFFRALLTNWENGEATIVCSYLNDGTPVGGNFLLSFGDIIENCWAGTLYEYNKLFVPYLNYSEMIKYSINKGYKIFSFGRSSKDSGTLKFKKHWNPQIIQIYYNTSSNHKRKIKINTIHELYKKIIPEDVNTILGSVLTKYIY